MPGVLTVMSTVPVHITVVSAMPVPPAEGVPIPPAGGATLDFSSLLATQLAAGSPPGLAPFLPEGEAGDATEGPAAPPGGQAEAGVSMSFLPPFMLPPPAPAAAAQGEEPPSGLPYPASAGMVTTGGRETVEEGRAANLAASLPPLPAFASGPSAMTASTDGRPAALMESGPTPAAGVPDVSAAAFLAVPEEGARASRTAPPAAVPAPGTAVSVPLGGPAWGEEFGQRVVWVARQGEQLAHISVTPPQLGPVEIRLNVTQDQASLSFVSPHAQVREAIEAALPRLREMLADSGLVLAHVDVSAQGFRHPGGEAAGFGVSGRGAGDPGSSAPHGIRERGGPPTLRGGEGLVDVFA